MRKLGKLSETEMEIMKIIWELETPITVSRLLAIFEKSKNWKTSTLSTILSRLIDKGFLSKKMKGNVNFYNVESTLHEYQKQEAQNLLSILYDGNVKNFVATLVDDETISHEDIEELKKWFQNKVGDKQ